MPYVISLLRVAKFLAVPNARVLVVVDTPELRTILSATIAQRAEEGVEPWASATRLYEGWNVEMANGSELNFRVVNSLAETFWLSGTRYTNVLYTIKSQQQTSTWLRSLVRAPEDFTGEVTCEPLEEMRDSL